MSRAYRITVKEADTRHLKAGDEIATQLEILEILPAGRHGHAPERRTQEARFRGAGRRHTLRKDGDVTVKVDPCSGEVSVKAETEETVSQEAKRDATGFNDVGPNESSLRGRVQDQLKSGPRQEVRAGTKPRSRTRRPRSWKSTSRNFSRRLPRS